MQNNERRLLLTNLELQECVSLNYAYNKGERHNLAFLSLATA